VTNAPTAALGAVYSELANVSMLARLPNPEEGTREFWFATVIGEDITRGNLFFLEPPMCANRL
jgi:hypothetical protein